MGDVWVITCTFTLNNRPMSQLECAAVGTFPAFSGRNDGRNNPDATGKSDIGPLPLGTYYIIGRESGGHLGWLYDLVETHIYGTDRSRWFALYRDDGVVDDETVVDGIKRGAFRLHPIGPLGLSEGCITMSDIHQFERLRAALMKQGPTVMVPGSGVRAYGTIEVK
jgi:hypothetical protein